MTTPSRCVALPPGLNFDRLWSALGTLAFASWEQVLYFVETPDPNPTGNAVVGSVVWGG